MNKLFSFLYLKYSRKSKYPCPHLCLPCKHKKECWRDYSSITEDAIIPPKKIL